MWEGDEKGDSFREVVGELGHGDERDGGVDIGNHPSSMSGPITSDQSVWGYM